MAQAGGDRGAPPGTYQRPKPPRQLFKRTGMPAGPVEPTLFWSSDGVLHWDRELTRPTSWVIVEVADPEDHDLDDDRDWSDDDEGGE